MTTSSCVSCEKEGGYKIEISSAHWLGKITAENKPSIVRGDIDLKGNFCGDHAIKRLEIAINQIALIESKYATDSKKEAQQKK